MTPSEAVRIAINRSGKKQADLVETGIVQSAQAANRKFRESRWPIMDLLKVAQWTGSKIIFQMPDGEQFELTIPENKKSADSR